MKRWRKHHVLFLLLVCIVGLIGCSRTRIIDKVSIVHVFGFDQAENGQLIGTALFPEYTKSKDSNQIRYLEEQAESSVFIISKMATHTSTPIEVAKTRVLLFGKSYAEAGIRNMVERFIITPQLGTNIQIAVSTHSAQETLSTFQKEKSLTLAERIQHNMEKQSLPSMNLHVFLNHFFGEGMDAYVPMVTIDDKDTIKVDGVGIFKDDKLKLHLDPEQTVLFSILKVPYTEATLKIDMDEKDPREVLAVRTFQSKSHWDWDHKRQQLNLRLILEWTVIQYPNRFNLEKAEDVRKLEKLIEDKLEEEIGNFLTTLKENEVDPLGIGNIVRSKDRTWEEESFYKEYPTLPIHVNVDLQIIHSGLES